MASNKHRRQASSISKPTNIRSTKKPFQKLWNAPSLSVSREYNTPISRVVEGAFDTSELPNEALHAPYDTESTISVEISTEEQSLMQQFIDESAALQIQGIKAQSASWKKLVLQYSDLFKASLQSSVPKQEATNGESARINDRHSAIKYVYGPEISSGSGKEGKGEDGNGPLHMNEEDGKEEDAGEDNESEEDDDGNDGLSVMDMNSRKDTSHHAKTDLGATKAEDDGNDSCSSMHTSDDGSTESHSETHTKSVLNDLFMDKLRPKDKNQKMDSQKQTSKNSGTADPFTKKEKTEPDRPARPRKVWQPNCLVASKMRNGKPEQRYTGRYVQPVPAPAVPPPSSAPPDTPLNRKVTKTKNTERQDVGAWDPDCK